MFIAQTPPPAPQVVPISINISANDSIICPVVTTFMGAGDTHNPIEVANVQAVLKNIEKMDVDVTGKFDEKTDIAVKAFQKKYASEVLAPWDATRASGVINITTAKKLNNIACKQPMTLNAQELAIINNYKARSQSNGNTYIDKYSTSDIQPVMTYSGAPAAPKAPAAPSTPIATSVIGSNEQAAAAESVSDGSLSSRFWSYLRGLFGGR